MTQKPESRLQRRIHKTLEATFPGSRFYKIWGGEFQVSGIPDLVGCVEGLFFGLEVKRPGEEPSRVQRHEINRINEAGGIACVVHSVEEAIDAVRKGLESG